MPTKPLPPRARLDQLKKQAKDLIADRRSAAPDAAQRIREFHPRFRAVSDAAIAAAPFTLADAQLTIAREYGFASWPRLKAQVENPERPSADVPRHERITDPVFRRAVDLLDSGDAEALRAYLAQHPDVVRRHVRFEGDNYFTNPTLLEFIAENPTRHERLPENIVDVARVILDAGAREDRAAVNETLGLVTSSRVARESGAQTALIRLLCAYGADPNFGLSPAALYGEFAAIETLLACGARIDLPTAAVTGRLDDARATFATADDDTRRVALALAAQFGRFDVARFLLENGVDPSGYTPPGAHSHATPLHQAALSGDERIVRLLLQHGADPNVRDIHHHATPGGWAEYFGHAELARELQRRESGEPPKRKRTRPQ